METDIQKVWKCKGDAVNLLDNLERKIKTRENKTPKNWWCYVKIKSEIGRIWRKKKKLYNDLQTCTKEIA